VKIALLAKLAEALLRRRWLLAVSLSSEKRSPGSGCGINGPDSFLFRVSFPPGDDTVIRVVPVIRSYPPGVKGGRKYKRTTT
jgi:hypothetical protein